MNILQTTGDSETDFALSEHDEVVDFLYDRAASSDWDLPITPQEWLAWVRDEIEVQRSCIDSHPNEREQRQPFLEELIAVDLHLSMRDIQPAMLPWED